VERFPIQDVTEENMKKGPNKKSSITRKTRFGLMAGGTFASLSLSTLHAQEPPAAVQAPQVELLGRPDCPSDQGSGPECVLTPPMLGDLLILPPRTSPSLTFRTGGVSAQGFKIAEDESPMPMDRVFTTFNYYGDVRPNAFQQGGFGQANIYREMFGLEKTFLDGDASIGIRAPLSTLDVQTGSTQPGFSSTNFGDLNVIFKYAMLNDHATGNVISTGLVVTTPTGPIDTFHDVKLQPFVGGIWNIGDWYFHGFTSLAVPTDSNDTTLLFNDLGVGYRLYSDGGSCAVVTGIIPTAEVHVNTPLNHTGDPIVNSVDLTQGVAFDLWNRAWLTVGVSENITGPSTYHIEAIVQLNMRF
jgi:hypothetical protein